MFISCSCLSSLWGSKCSWFIVFNVRIVARQWHFISPSVIERKHHTLDQMAEKARQIDAPFLGVFVVEQGKIWMPIARWQGNTRSPTVKVCTNKAILCWAHLLLTNSQLTSRFRCSQKLQSFHCHLYFNTPLKFFVYQIFIGRSATQSHTMLGCGAPHLFKQFLHKCWKSWSLCRAMQVKSCCTREHREVERLEGGSFLSHPDLDFKMPQRGQDSKSNSNSESQWNEHCTETVASDVILFRTWELLFTASAMSTTHNLRYCFAVRLSQNQWSIHTVQVLSDALSQLAWMAPGSLHVLTFDWGQPDTAFKPKASEGSTILQDWQKGHEKGYWKRH